MPEKADKSHTNLPQRKCELDIVHSKQKSLEKMKQPGSKTSSTLDPERKGLFTLKMQNYMQMEPTAQGS